MSKKTVSQISGSHTFTAINSLKVFSNVKKVAILFLTFFGGLQFASAQTPSAQPTGFVASAKTPSGMTISWTAASGTPIGYVVLRTINAGTTYPNTAPVDGNAYSVGNTIGNATVVYSGSATTTTVTGLTASSQYSYSIYSYNGPVAASRKYLASNPLRGQAYTVATNVFVSQPTGFMVVNYNTAGQLNPSWEVKDLTNNGLNGGYLVIYAPSGTTASLTSVNGEAPSVGAGSSYVSVANAYSPNPASPIIGLTSCVTYNFLLVPYTWDGSNASTYNYYTSGARTASQTVYGLPSLNNPTVTVTSPTSATLGATLGSICGAAEIQNRGTTYATSSPVNAYYQNLDASGTSVGTFSHSRTGLYPQTLYYFAGYAKNSNNQVGLSNESTFYTWSNPPTVQPSSFTATGGAAQFTANWSTASFPLSFATKAGYLLIYAPTGTTPALSSTNGTAPVASAGTIVTIANTNLPSTPALTTVVTGLAVNTYNLLLIPYTWDGTNAATYNYLKTSAKTTTVTALAGTTPTIGTLTIPTKTFGNAAFTITAPTSNSTGAFSYTSSNTSVATISGNTITIVGAGSTTITANQAAAGIYRTGSVTANFTVNKAALTVTANVQTVPYATSVATVTGAGSYSINGYVNGQTASSITVGTASYTTNYTNTTAIEASGITITPSLSGFSATNYSFNTATGSIRVICNTNTWTGATNSLWNVGSNWCSGNVPTSGANIIVPAGITNQPSLVLGTTIGNLSIASGATLDLNGNTLTLNGAITGTGTLKSSSASSIVIDGNAGTINFAANGNTIKDVTLNSNATATLGNALAITAGATAGTVTIASAANLTTDGNLTLKSDALGTARVANSAGTITGEVTVERYIPSKSARKFNFIASPVTQPIFNGWQNQMYITGAGTGGQTCGITSSNGGATDKYNSNWFDKTTVNSPSMYIYNATAVNGSRWVSIANTKTTNLAPGVGFRVNVRGDRTLGTCTDQLNSATPSAPTAVTLKSTGIIGQGTKVIALNSISSTLLSLVGNPYPSQISFAALYSANSGSMYRTMWTLSPYGNGNYTSYNNGLTTNSATGYSDVLGNTDFIASGQAFFVQAKSAANGGTGNITFNESMKISSLIPNNQYFGTSNNKLLRVTFHSNDVNSTKLDEVVVRFNNNGSSAYNPDWDAVSMSAGNQTLATLKGTARLAIATRQDSLVIDTAKLYISSTTVDTFHLSFNDYQGIDSNETIILRDKYLSINHNVRANQVYTFTITADSASKGSNRFEIVFSKGGTTLPVNFTSIKANKTEKGVEVNWKVAQQTNIKEYAVERSIDGIHFASIATIKASTVNEYSYLDKQLATVTSIYYRIQSVENNNEKGYSAIAHVSINSTETAVSIYPNPVKDVMNLQFTGVTLGKCSISIISVLGKEVVRKNSVEINNQQMSLPVNNLSSGVYLVEILGATGEKFTTKMIKE